MSSAVISTSAAQSRLFIFDDESAPEVSCYPEPALNRGAPSLSCRSLAGQGRDFDFRTSVSNFRQRSADPRLAHITSASCLAIRPAAEMVSSGIAALDALTGGLPRGCITEICGPASSGRTSVLLAALAVATQRGECCALIDASDALNPHSLAVARVNLDRLLWVRCGPSLCKGGRLRPPRYPEQSEKKRADVHESQKSTEKKGNETNRGCPTLLSRFVRKRVGNDSQSALHSDKSEFRASEHRLDLVLRVTDLLLESGGFGLIALDLADVPPESARRIPLTTWFRFRRAIEHTPTILLVIEPQPIAGSCSSLRLQVGVPGTQYPVPSSKPSHSHLLTGLEITVELIRSRLERKPAHSVAFETRTAWAG